LRRRPTPPSVRGGGAPLGFAADRAPSSGPDLALRSLFPFAPSSRMGLAPPLLAIDQEYFTSPPPPFDSSIGKIETIHFHLGHVGHYKSDDQTTRTIKSLFRADNATKG
jgi:hypothetical protein